MVLGVTDSPSNPMSQNTGQICRPYKCLTLSSEGWCGIVSGANDIVLMIMKNTFTVSLAHPPRQ